MADRDFRIDLLMRAHFEQAQKALEDADRKLSGIGKTLDKVNARGITVGTALRGVGVAATAAATAAVAVLGLYISKTIEAEKVQAQLGARIKDTGGVAGRTLDQLNEQASKLQNVTVFDDEAIGNAQALLLTFTQIRGVNFDRTIEAATNLATVMDTDVTDAAKILGKALSEPEKGLGALRKAGVTFTDAQTEQISKMMEAGKIAEAQAVILDKLQSTMGSAASAARDTLGGALQALKGYFDNLLEGKSGDAGIVGTRNAVEDLIRTLNDPATKQGFDNMISGIVSAIGYLTRFATTTANVTKFIGEEIAARVNGPSIDDTVRIEDRIRRLQKTITEVQKFRDQGLLFNSTFFEKASELVPSDFLKSPAAVIARLQGELSKEQNKLQIGVELNDSSVSKAAKIAADAAAPLSNPAPEGEGIAKPTKTKPSGDPDADIKKRIDSLREESALLGQVKDGEDKASEAAKARYDTTEGEFKNKSPQLKAELIAAAEALDAKNADIEAEKKRKQAIEDTKKAYAEMVDGLRTPAEVAVDEAIAKLKTLNEAMKDGIATKAEYDQAQLRIAAGVVGDQPTFQGLAPEVGGPYGELGKLDEAAAAEEKWYQDSLQRLEAYRAQKDASQQAADAEEETVEAAHQQRMRKIEEARQQANLAIMSNFFGQIAELQHSHNSKAAAVGKAAAIAQAIINTYQAATEAYKAMAGIYAIGPVLGAAAAAAAIAAGMANVAAIRAQPTGYAEGGYTGPGGKYQPAGIVHKGEGVLTQEEIAALGGPSGFFDLQRAIADGTLRERIYGWAGYADGGLVGARGPVSATDWSAMDRNRAAAMGGGQGGKLSVYALFSEDELAQRLANHPVMEKRIVAVAGENGAAIRSEW
jgi:hypothetical protein